MTFLISLSTARGSSCTKKIGCMKDDFLSPTLVFLSELVLSFSSLRKISLTHENSLSFASKSHSANLHQLIIHCDSKGWSWGLSKTKNLSHFASSNVYFFFLRWLSYYSPHHHRAAAKCMHWFLRNITVMEKPKIFYAWQHYV